MTVWTIAAQEGTGGARLAAELALAADVPLLDRTALAALAHQTDPDCPEDDELDRRLGGRLHTLALSTAITAGSPEAFRDVDRFLDWHPRRLGCGVPPVSIRTPVKAEKLVSYVNVK